MKRKEEIDKVNSTDIRKLEKILRSINEEEQRLLEEFDSSISDILGDSLVLILKGYESLGLTDGILFIYNGKNYYLPKNFLLNFHSSYINDTQIKESFLNDIGKWFSKKTESLKNNIRENDNYEEIKENLPEAFALSSLALTTFHRKPEMYLRDVQKLAAISMSRGDISELSTGEGKTISAVLPLYLYGLRGKGSHLVTANNYLAYRDYEELRPIYEGLGLSVGYLPEDITEQAVIEGLDPDNLSPEDRYNLQQKVFAIKREAYRKDITYGSKATFAFDYLRDCSITKLEEMIQRPERPGYAVVDEVDDLLIDDALTPYRIAGEAKKYRENLTFYDVSIMYNEDYETLLSKARKLGIRREPLSFDDARYLTDALFSEEILPDDSHYLKIANIFYKTQNNIELNNTQFEQFLQPDLYDISDVEENYGIVYSKSLGKHELTKKCMDEFLEYSYIALKLRSKIYLVGNQILKDNNYKMGIDYYIDDNTGRVRLTQIGSKRILTDQNYPIIYEDYQNFQNNITPDFSILSHYLNQIVIANLFMKNGADYTVQNGKVKPMKNGRVEEGSTFTNGLQQALEIINGFRDDEITKETSTFSSVTQKNYYRRYDAYSGMTGTSSKELFERVYKKQTIEIPKHAYYEFYSKNQGNKPKDVLKDSPKFSLNDEDKFNLIIESIKKSIISGQPVLLVTSDVDEIKKLEELFNRNNIEYQTVSLNDDKEEEARKLARAGLAGMVTISTEMAGRGTDIKLGGDRDTILDILTKRYIRHIEEKEGYRLDLTPSEFDIFRRKVEDEYLILGYIWTKEEETNTKKIIEDQGLKVISSGYFKVGRIDLQLEGRTGRNGFGGVCERYASLKDIAMLGIDIGPIEEKFRRFSKNSDGSIELDFNYKNILERKIEEKQSNNEEDIKSRIEYSQQTNEFSMNAIEEYREKRRAVLSDSCDKAREVVDAIGIAATAVISEHLDDVNKNTVNNLVAEADEADLSELLLDIKEVFGITLNREILDNNQLTYQELRDQLIRMTAENIEKNPDFYNVVKKILIDHNDYMIANIPYLVDTSQQYKGLISIAGGFDGVVDPLTTMNFFESRDLLNVQASMIAIKRSMGEIISYDDYQKTLSNKDSKGGYVVERIDEQLTEKGPTFIEKIRKFQKLIGDKSINVRVSEETFRELSDSGLLPFIELVRGDCQEKKVDEHKSK